MRALLVGNSKYHSSSQLPALSCCANAAAGLGVILSGNRKASLSGSNDNQNVEVLLDRGREDIEPAITRLLSRRGHVLLLLSGHCINASRRSEDGFVFAPSDMHFDRPRETGIWTIWLAEALDSGHFDHAAVILDCCYSGSLPVTFNARHLKSRGRVSFLCSAAPDQTAAAGGVVSPFMRAVFDELLAHTCERNHDFVTLADLSIALKSIEFDGHVPEYHPPGRGEPFPLLKARCPATVTRLEPPDIPSSEVVPAFAPPAPQLPARRRFSDLVRLPEPLMLLRRQFHMEPRELGRLIHWPLRVTTPPSLGAVYAIKQQYYEKGITYSAHMARITTRPVSSYPDEDTLRWHLKRGRNSSPKYVRDGGAVVKCPTCRGNGFVEGGCATCSGVGSIIAKSEPCPVHRVNEISRLPYFDYQLYERQDQGWFLDTRPGECTMCAEAGRAVKRECPSCGGSGDVCCSTCGGDMRVRQTILAHVEEALRTYVISQKTKVNLEGVEVSCSADKSAIYLSELRLHLDAEAQFIKSTQDTGLVDYFLEPDSVRSDIAAWGLDYTALVLPVARVEYRTLTLRRRAAYVWGKDRNVQLPDEVASLHDVIVGFAGALGLILVLIFCLTSIV